ncbi:MAG TPA: hypothetical protein VGF77_10475 [Allosphingosinicella sp.]|jgi:hypothetical protein
MSIRAKIGTVTRWATWPILVVVGFNIENAASQAGYGILINQHWKDSIPMLKTAYEMASSPFITYPSLMLLGASLYEWIARIVDKAELPGRGFQRWLIKFNSDVTSGVFLKNGYYRRTMKPADLKTMNRRLGTCGLPLIPETFKDERLNGIYGSYLALLAKGRFEHAQEFIKGQI